MLGSASPGQECLASKLQFSAADGSWTPWRNRSSRCRSHGGDSSARTPPGSARVAWTPRCQIRRAEISARVWTGAPRIRCSRHGCRPGGPAGPPGRSSSRVRSAAPMGTIVIGTTRSSSRTAGSGAPGRGRTRLRGPRHRRAIARLLAGLRHDPARGPHGVLGGVAPARGKDPRLADGDGGGRRRRPGGDSEDDDGRHA